MPTFSHTTSLPYPREDVFAWFQRPGAIVRLAPGFGGSVRQEPSRGIEQGSTAVMGIAAPGALGLWLSAATGAAQGSLRLPGWLKPEVPWHALHVEMEPGRSFTDAMESGPLSKWTHTHTFTDGTGGVEGSPGTTMVDRINYELPVVSTHRGSGLAGRSQAWVEGRFERELERIFAYRERQLLADLAFHAAHQGPPRTIAVAGASGLIGTQLCALLAGGGHRVIRLVRRAPRNANEIRWDPGHGLLDHGALQECDTVINLAGHTIGGRFTHRNKQRIVVSRITGASLLAHALADVSYDGVQRTLVCASAVGYYGATPNESLDELLGAHRDKPQPLDEDSPPGGDFLAQVCQRWERACRPAAQAGVRVVNVRTGVVLSPAGGVLQRLLPLYLAGLGGPIGKQEWQSWVSIDDIAGIFAHAALDPGVSGPVNGVAPNPVTAKTFAKTLGKVLHRPALVPVPVFGPELLLGKEGARELAQADQMVSSAKIQSTGYVFRHRTLAEALGHVLGGQA